MSLAHLCDTQAAFDAHWRLSSLPSVHVAGVLTPDAAEFKDPRLGEYHRPVTPVVAARADAIFKVICTCGPQTRRQLAEAIRASDSTIDRAAQYLAGLGRIVAIRGDHNHIIWCQA